MAGFDLRANRGPPGGRALPGVPSATPGFLKLLRGIAGCQARLPLSSDHLFDLFGSLAGSQCHVASASCRCSESIYLAEMVSDRMNKICRKAPGPRLRFRPPSQAASGSPGRIFLVRGRGFRHGILQRPASCERGHCLVGRSKEAVSSVAMVS